MVKPTTLGLVLVVRLARGGKLHAEIVGLAIERGKHPRFRENQKQECYDQPYEPVPFNQGFK
jgi:hypothetical protein